MTQPAVGRPSATRHALSVFGIALACTLAACSGGGGSSDTTTGSGNPKLSTVEFGRLVDVYGYRTSPQGISVELYQTDMIVGSNVQDERDSQRPRRDDEILYDFISSNPSTLQPRLLIPREIGSPEFVSAVDALDDELRLVTPLEFSQGSTALPFSVVPRNAGIRLTFTSSLGITDDFFVVRNPEGQVVGIRNAEAVQLLQIADDPNGPNASTAFRVLPTRIIVRDNQLLLDPVLLGTEGTQYQTRNNAAGMPAAPDQLGANIRIAVALEGPLAISRLRAAEDDLVGKNNSAQQSIIRDFRSGNSADDSADISRGFVRDPIPPRLVGEIVTYLERVDPVNPFVQEIEIYKNGVQHRIDRGDVLKFVVDNTGFVAYTSEVVADPQDTAAAQHTRLRIRATPGLLDIDPRRIPGYPSELSLREPWLVANAPKVVVVCEYEAGGRPDPVTQQPIGDNPAYFLTFSPAPLPNSNGTPSAPTENVSPFAGAVMRFTKPVDLDTVKPADTFFFATRNLLDQAAIDNFVATVKNDPTNPASVGMDPLAFNKDKFWTPHLVASRVADEDGSQTALRLQPISGFYLDDRMRNPQPNEDFRYFLHMVTGPSGIRDLSGNAVDLQADVVERSESVVIPFSLDTRTSGSSPLFENNLAVSIVRRNATEDEDTMPSYYWPAEVQPPGVAARYEAFALQDLFGAFFYLDGELQARPTTRVRKVADNLNQAPVASQNSPLRWCPTSVAGEEQIPSNSSTAVFPAPIQNPLNPYGSRLQTVWREIDLSLSRVDPFDFNLDVEQMYWAPFAGGTISFDELDRTSLFLGHSERRPEPCVGNFSALPTFPDSGLNLNFNENYVANKRANVAAVDTQPAPFPAYVDTPLVIDPARSVLEPNQVNRFLPLPEFRKPYFVYRDETVIEQGCVTGTGADIQNGLATYNPWIITPWSNGNGRRVAPVGTTLTFIDAFWNNCVNYLMNNNRVLDQYTDGLTGNIALPLLGDFWTYCDSPNLPAGNGYVALGTNGWQTALTVQSDPNPNFRAYSGGRPPAGASPAICVGPGGNQWNVASGGYGAGGSVTRSRDNTFYWIMIDFLKRATVATNGFVDILNPHRVYIGASQPISPDPRLGPFFPAGATDRLPQNIVPVFSYDFDPPLTSLPSGTSVVAQFRGAGIVDPGSTLTNLQGPWYWSQWVNQGTFYPATIRTILRPSFENFALDPFKAADAHIRKFDDRPPQGTTQPRNWWTYLYNRTVTSYVQDPNQLANPTYLSGFAGPNEGFTPRDVRYVNWRFLMSNNTAATPPVSPSIDTFIFSYRFQRSN